MVCPATLSGPKVLSVFDIKFAIGNCYWSLTLLWYHEKSCFNSTMGSIWPHCKKNSIKTQFITTFLLQIVFHNRFVLKYRQTHRQDFVLGNFEYIEADREIYRRCIIKRKQYTRSKKTLLTHRCYANLLASIIFRPTACSTYFGALFADNYLYYMEGTMGSICPQAEININKK
jgi:hypothetical protein